MKYLRELKRTDVNSMLEWMKDSEINCFFQFDSDKVSKHEALEFIDQANIPQNKRSSYHFAIIDESSNYLGTISLKNVDYRAKTAEYAIATRKCAHGKGYAEKATKELLQFGFETLQLNRVYLNVLDENIRAIKFYEKLGFHYEGLFRQHLYIKDKVVSLRWYALLKKEYEEIKEVEKVDAK